ncbi:hypothetical protein [Agaribacterium sp. ZY112]|uniref:hypothetical protein n=1 Tax=Agaribacterium sp. ZY112 TaxID=3233574 RepID=UPI0035247BA2
MRFLIKAFSVLAFFMSTSSFSDVFSIEGNTQQGVVIPGLDFNGIATGSIKASLDERTGLTKVDQLTLAFSEGSPFPAKTLSIKSGFVSNSNEPDTITVVKKDQWLFRAVRVSIENFDALSLADSVRIRVSVESSDSYVSDDEPSQFDFDLFTLDAQVEKVIPFTLADVHSQQHQGKRLTLKLNENYSHNLDPINGPVGEGAELKVSWLGHGTGTAFIPVGQWQPGMKMIGVDVSNPTGLFGMDEVVIRYQRTVGGPVEFSPSLPLEMLVNDALAD